MGQVERPAHALDPNNPRLRSFGGCATCRNRHIKCDEKRPTCSSCKKSGLFCGGYEKTIFFDHEAPNNGEGVRFRRPLLTETERQQMSESLTAMIPPKLAMSHLLQIDEECESPSAVGGAQIEVRHGPFAAFRLNQISLESTLPEQVDDSDTASLHNDADEAVLANDSCAPFSDLLAPSDSSDLAWPILDQANEVAVPSVSDYWAVSTNMNYIGDMYESTAPFYNQINFDHMPMLQGDQSQSFLPFIQGFTGRSPAPCPDLTVANAYNTVPPDVNVLLKYYESTVIPSLTPFGHHKTPWHVLFLPLAKNCLAALVLNEKVDHAVMTTFYGILAMSAFSLSTVSDSQMWLDRAKSYEMKAREHFGVMQQQAYDVPKRAKYKSILMAFIAITQVSMFFGKRRETDAYLVETEKFVRLKGLIRKKSRKVRLLHHCYVYMRIFHESIFFGGTDSNQRRLVRKAIESSQLTVRGQDSPNFRMMNWKDLDQELQSIKTQEEGENDLHLGQPGTFFATMYPEIFGIPESWFYLFSQVIRLGNEKEAPKESRASGTPGLDEFLDRARAIERNIHALAIPSSTTGHFPHNTCSADGNVLRDVLEIMKSSLTMYFYRRIYNLDASMLQQNVRSIRDGLLRYENSDHSGIHGSVGLIWPAFIAACEAEDVELQISFSEWFTNRAQKSGLLCFTKNLNFIQRVWQEKRKTNGTKKTWYDLLKKNPP